MIAGPQAHGLDYGHVPDPPDGVSGPAPAATASGLHATFAFWPTEALERIAPLLRRPGGIALHRLLAEAGARKVRFDDETAFTNINTPQDLAKAEALIRAGLSPVARSR